MGFRMIASNKDSILFEREGVPDYMYYFYNRMTHKEFFMEILIRKEPSRYSWTDRHPSRQFSTFVAREQLPYKQYEWKLEARKQYEKQLEWDDWHRLRRDPTPWIMEALL